MTTAFVFFSTLTSISVTVAVSAARSRVSRHAPGLLAVISAPETASTASATTVTPFTASATRTGHAPVGCNAIQPVGYLLFRFDQQIHHAARQIPVAIVEKRRGQTQITHTTRTSDTVDVLLDVGRQIEIDHVLDVGDVETASGHRRGHQNGGVARSG